MNYITPGFRDAFVSGLLVFLIGRLVDFIRARRAPKSIGKPGLYSIVRYGLFLVMGVVLVIWLAIESMHLHQHRGFIFGFLFGLNLFGIPFWSLSIYWNTINLREGVRIYQQYIELVRLQTETISLREENKKQSALTEKYINHLTLQNNEIEALIAQAEELCNKIGLLYPDSSDVPRELAILKEKRDAILRERKSNEAILRDLQLQNSANDISTQESANKLHQFAQKSIELERKSRKGFWP